MVQVRLYQNWLKPWGFLMLSTVCHLFVLCSFMLFVQSQQPAPTPAKVGQDQQQHAGGEHAAKGESDTTAQPRPAVVAKPDSRMNGSERSQEGTHHKDSAPPDRWGTYADWIVAGAAIIALFIYFSQARHMGAANRVSAAVIEQMRLEQRAWIGPMAISISKPLKELDSGERPQCVLSIKNNGRTPGQIDRFRAIFRHCSELEATLEKMAADVVSSTDERHFILPPNGSLRQPINSENGVDHSLAPLFVSGELTLALTVYFEYLDARNVRRETHCTYCYHRTLGNMVAYPKFNKMT